MERSSEGIRAGQGAPGAVMVSLPDWALDRVDSSAPCVDRRERVRLAVALARENVARRTGGPFGAAVFERASGRLLAIGLNGVTRLGNSVAHAEIVALMLAQRRIGSYLLKGPGDDSYELVSSCEPCAMCLGAVLWSGVESLVWSADRDDALAIGFDEGPVFPESIRYLERRGIQIVPGLLREEGRAVLEEYRESGGAIYGAPPRPARTARPRTLP